MNNITTVNSFISREGDVERKQREITHQRAEVFQIIQITAVQSLIAGSTVTVGIKYFWLKSMS